MANWSTISTFWISGTPRPQNRPHPRVRLLAGVSQFRSVRTPAEIYRLVRGDVYQDSDVPGTPLNKWKETIKTESGRHVPDIPLSGPVRVDVTIYLPRPKYMQGGKYPDNPILHDKVGDRDNFDKTILDAMSDVGWWGNDGQVCSGLIEKYYHARRGTPGVKITVSAVEQQPTLLGGVT